MALRRSIRACKSLEFARQRSGHARRHDETRDRIIADLARRYLDMMLRYPGLDHVMCWGMLDHHSWLQVRTRRADGMLKPEAAHMIPTISPSLCAKRLPMPSAMRRCAAETAKSKISKT